MKPGRDQDFDAKHIACHACAARDRAVNAAREAKADMAGAYFPITERGG